MKGKLLSEKEIKDLKNGQTVWIEYLDEKIFDIEYCKTVPINTYLNKLLIDTDGNEYELQKALILVKNRSIEIYENVNEENVRVDSKQVFQATAIEDGQYINLERLPYSNDLYITTYYFDDSIDKLTVSKEDALKLAKAIIKEFE